MVEVKAVVVFRAGSSILVGKPVEHLEQHPWISAEGWGGGLLFLSFLGLLCGLLSLLGLFLLAGLDLLGSQWQYLLAIGHDHLALGRGIGRSQYTSPLFHHIGLVIGTDGGGHITIRSHLAQQQAHLHIIVEAGTVGIHDYGQDTMLGHHFLQVLGAIHCEAGA